MITNIVSWLAGKKTYLVCLLGVLYGWGIHKKWWPNESEIWGCLGFTGAATMRAAITKLCRLFTADVSRPPVPGSHLMLALLCAFAFSSCATVGDYATPENAHSAATIVCSNTITFAVDEAHRVEAANYVYAVAHAIRSLSGGQVPTPTELEAAIRVFTPHSSQWVTLGANIGVIYSAIYPRIQGDPRLALAYLEAIAAGCEDAAVPFLPPPPAQADRQSTDYKRFETWLARVRKEAPRNGLQLLPGDEGDEEFFYLYCWQSDDRSIVHAIRTAQKVWSKSK